MKSSRNINKSVKTLNIAAGPKMQDRILTDLLKVMEESKKTQSAPVQPNYWGTIMKSPITKLTAAAVIIMAVSIGLMHRLSNGEAQVKIGTQVKIPTELLQMPVEQLLDIHFGKAESPFHSTVVTAAVKMALDRLSARQVIDMTSRYRKTVPRPTARRTYRPIPLSEAIEASDLVVRARADKVTLDVNDLKDAVVNRQLNRREDFLAWIKATVDLHVFEVYPPPSPLDGETLRLRPVFPVDRLNIFQEGKEYLVALKKYQNIIWTLPHVEGVYHVDPGSSLVSPPEGEPMKLDRMWQLIIELYNATRDVNQPSGDVSDYSARDFCSRMAHMPPEQTRQDTQPPQTTDQNSFARKQEIQNVIDRYNQGKTSIGVVINVMRKRLEPEDKEFIPFLCETLMTHEAIAGLIARNLPDPSFVPLLKQALENEVRVELIEALFTCGEKEEAVQIALAQLDQPVNEQEYRTFKRDIGKYAALVGFLGATANKSVQSVVEHFTREDVIQAYHKTNERLGGRRPFVVNQLRQSAVLALARVGGKSAIPRVRELYASDDIHIRILAALGLHYLGDDTGCELLAHFVNNTHRSVPEIEMRWHVDLANGEAFQAPILGDLSSPRTQALLLERFRHGFDSADSRAFHVSAFTRRYERLILPILVDQLRSRDRTTRKYANEFLNRLTGQDFGFQYQKFIGQQDDAIERWRLYVQDYLATGAGSPNQRYR